MKTTFSRDLCSIGLALAFALAGMQLEAQSSAVSATCGTAPYAVQSFLLERTVIPSNVETTYETSIPPNVLITLAVGALEIRERLTYDSQANTVTSTMFLVEPGSPIPTPTGVDISSATLAVYAISVNGVHASCSPVPSFLLAGTVTSASGGPSLPNGIYNLNFDASPAAVSIGYTTGDSSKVNNVVVMFAGLVTSYSAAGAGTLKFSANPVTTPP